MTSPQRTYVYTREREKRKPPPQRARVLEFIKDMIAQNDRFPAMCEIQFHMGWKTYSSAKDALDGLVRDGQLRKVYHGQRTGTWEVVE